MVWARTRVEGLQGTISEFVNADALANFRTDLGADLVGVTVIRVRGHVLFSTDLTTRVFTNGVFGARVFTEATTVTDALGPAKDRHADWFMWQPMAFISDQTSGGGNLQRMDIDVRSSRKIDEIGQSILFGWDKEDGAGLIGASGYLSWLLKLP